MSLKPATLIVLLTCSLFPVAAAAVTHTVGIARDSDDIVQYIEHHRYLESGAHEVRYYDPSFRLLLEKQLAYPAAGHQPELDQQDPVNEISVTIRRQGNSALMRRLTADDTEEYRFELSDDVIIDAGFDAYIQQEWSGFETDPEREIRLAVAGQSRLLKMKLTYLGDQDGQLVYDADRRLQVYDGLSNLPLNTGPVSIEFRHMKEDPLPLIQDEISLLQ